MDPIKINATITLGQKGKSAYQYYTETTTDDPVLTLEQWVAKATNAADSAAQAAASELAAAGSANGANDSANIATTKAGEAATSETNANNSAIAAAGSAGTATTKANEADVSANAATEKAAEADVSAQVANQKSGEAATSENNAVVSAGIATTKANEASESANSAAASAVQAAADALQVGDTVPGALAANVAALQVNAALKADVEGEGYDVVVLAGQSNMVGRGGPIITTYDQLDSRIYQWGNVSNTVTPAVHPLEHIGVVANQIGMGVDFAKEYANNRLEGKRKILLVPVAVGGTAFNTGYWVSGGAGHENAVAQTNAAMGGAGSGNNNRLVAILWHQGENDSAAGWNQTQYTAALTAMVDSFRTRMTGADTTTPFIVGALLESRYNPAADPIQLALADAPNYISYCSFVSSNGLTDKGDNLHFDAASLRAFGGLYYAQLSAAKANLGREVGSLGHWLFGADNATLADVGGGNTLTALNTAPTLSAGFMTLADGQLNGCQSTHGGSLAEFTMIVVVKPNNGNGMICGNLNTGGGSTGSSFYTNGAVIANNTRSGAAPNLVEFDASKWYFIALSINEGATRVDYLRGNYVTSVLDNQSTNIAESVEGFGVGDTTYNSASFTKGHNIAEFMIFTEAKTETQLDEIYDRSVARLALRDVDVL